MDRLRWSSLGIFLACIFLGLAKPEVAANPVIIALNSLAVVSLVVSSIYGIVMLTMSMRRMKELREAYDAMYEEIQPLFDTRLEDQIQEIVSDLPEYAAEGLKSRAEAVIVEKIHVMVAFSTVSSRYITLLKTLHITKRDYDAVTAEISAVDASARQAQERVASLESYLAELPPGF